MKCTKCPILHCKNSNSVVVDDEVKNNAKVYLSDDALDYAECEAGTIMPILNLLF